MCVLRLPGPEEQGGSELSRSQQRGLEPLPHGHQGESDLQRETHPSIHPSIQTLLSYSHPQLWNQEIETTKALIGRWRVACALFSQLIGCCVSVFPADQSQHRVSGCPGVHQPMVRRPANVRILLRLNADHRCCCLKSSHITFQIKENKCLDF